MEKANRATQAPPAKVLLESLIRALTVVEETRHDKGLRHPLINVLTIALLAITATRENTTTGEVNQETRYYITSRVLTAEQANEHVRGHWCLNMTFGQDASRIHHYQGDRYSVPRRRRLSDLHRHHRNRVLRAKVVG